MATEKGARPANAVARDRDLISDFEREIMELEGSSETRNVMIYGDSGCGKTWLTATLPGRVLWLAGEPGYIVAARAGGHGSVRIIPDTRTALAAIAWLEDKNYQKYDWIVPDGLSTMGNKFLLGYAAEAFDANPAKRAHRNLPDKPDYFNTQNFMKGWVARLIDLPTNVLFTAHCLRTESDEGELLVYPGIQGKGFEVSNFISGMMHVVGHMRDQLIDKGPKKGQQVRRILWRTTIDPKTDTKYFAKDQFNALGWFDDDTNMVDILARIDGGSAGTAPRRGGRRAA